MKKRITPAKISLLVIAALISLRSYSTSFTAVASGNWSSAATWSGGIVPPFINVSDAITIPVGISVTMDSDVIMNGALSSMLVNGTASSGNGNMFSVIMGTVSGTGTINVHDMVLGAGGLVAFTGTITAYNLNSAATSIQLNAITNVTHQLSLSGGILSIANSGSLWLSNHSILQLSGGSLALNGGTLNLTAAYKVIYTSNSAIAGPELTGSGLTSVTVHVGAGNTVSLLQDLTVPDTLNLVDGSLVLNGHDLTVTGEFVSSLNGYLLSTGSSNVTFHNTTGLAGEINFSGNNNSVNELTIDIGSLHHAHIQGNLEVMSTLHLSSGILSVGNASSLTLNGTLSGNGQLAGTSTSNLIINTSGGFNTPLNFENTANDWHNLALNVGLNNSIYTMSAVQVWGMLTLTGGSHLNIQGQTLTLYGDYSGTGMLEVDDNSTLNIQSNTSLTGNLVLSGNALGHFTMHAGTGHTVNMGSDLHISGLLNLQDGTLALNGHDLILTGDIANGGSGMIHSTTGSSIYISSANAPAGMLQFTANGHEVSNLTLNMAAGWITLGSDITVDNSLTLTHGGIDITGHTLEVLSGGSLSGGSSNSYILTGSTGHLMMHLSGSVSGWANFPVGTANAYMPALIHLSTASASGSVSAGAASHVYTAGTSGSSLSVTQPLVDATWFFNTDISSNLHLDMQLVWPVTAEINGFDHSAAYISHYTSGAWDEDAAVAATAAGSGMFSIERDNLTSLSPFAVFDHNTNPTGIAAVSAEALLLYPDPATDQILVANLTEPVTAEVIGLNGVLMGSWFLDKSNPVIPVSALQQGTYLIRIIQNGKEQTKKFTKL